MGMLECINRFVETMELEKNQFENMKNEISRRGNEVGQVLDNLSKNESEMIGSLKGKIAAVNDEAITAIFSNTSENIEQTIAEANQRIKEAVNGMEFIRKFENQFTVSVFGKVKAGKSYIGNFVMGQPLKEAKIASEYDNLGDLAVHVYDRGELYKQGKLSTFEEEKECNGKNFYVNKNEATSTIQWVNIGGMCWFDTPGIGSVTLENEELAKEYVKNSDLVIFACNSDAAGTRQEFSEIKKLYEMEKPILLLLTQSDTYDFDVDEEGNEISVLVPKSEKDRKDQEDYMLETLREQGLEDVLKYADILTVSAYLAVEAIKNQDENMFEQSNMGVLLDKLTEITKNDAADIKRNTPKGRINEMIDGIITDLTTMEEQISNTCAGIEQSRQELLDRKECMVEQVRAAVNLKVIEIVAKAKAEVENQKTVISEKQLAAQINEAIGETVKKVCAEEAIDKTGKVPDLNISLNGIGDMKMKTDRIAYEHQYVHKVSRPPEGFFEKVGEKVFHKEYYTSEMRSETKYSEFDIGVNDTEIAQNIVMQLDGVFAETIDGYMEHLTRGYYQPVEILERNTKNEISKAIDTLTGMRM